MKKIKSMSLDEIWLRDIAEQVEEDLEMSATIDNIGGFMTE